MDYEVKLDVFQGPLDLLLHLIEKNEIDIYNIPIALITEEYLNYLHTLQLLNLEVVGDFLVMAATLMQIKAKMLLPQLQNSDSEAELEEDPRMELARKLIEYKKIKEASLSLQELEQTQLKTYTRAGGEFADLKIAPVTDPLKDLSIWDLMDAFKTILESMEPITVNAIPKSDITVKQRMTELLDHMTEHGSISFTKVFSDVKTKIGLITCFLAVLELIRLHKIVAFQAGIFSEIMLTLTNPPDGGAPTQTGTE
ncbi:MAG TPA: segregation/condensation protein A [Bacillota bacterium]|nr:segregation/condensation protein A [Bacillota bacterium]